MGQWSLKLEWSIDALADLDRFVGFLIRRDERKLASIVAAELLEKSSLIADRPLIGRSVGRQSDYRKVVVRAAGAVYVLYYRVTDDRVVVLRVFHGREDRD